MLCFSENAGISNGREFDTLGSLSVGCAAPARSELYIEGQTNLQKMLQYIPVTDEERAVTEGDIKVFESLCQRLADVPTPAGPTPVS